MSIDRIATLREKLERIADARKLATTPVWAEAWTLCEQELLERLLAYGPENEMERYKLAEAIKVARRFRAIIETGGKGEAELLRELDILEGRRRAPIA